MKSNEEIVQGVLVSMSLQERQTEDGVYERISQELKDGSIQEGLWTRLFAEVDGDENRTKALYIRIRAAILNNGFGSSQSSDGISSGKQGSKAGEKKHAPGSFVIPAKYLKAKDFSEGLAAVQIGREGSGGKWGYIDRTGKVIIEPQFDTAGEFYNGFASVGVGYNGYTAGKWIDNRKYGFIDVTGKYVIPPIYDAAYHDEGNCFRVSEESRYGQHDFITIDYTGKKVEHPPRDFGKEGLALHTEFYDDDDLAMLEFGTYEIDKVHFWEKSKKGKRGYINRKGQWVIKPQFTEALDFVKQDLAPVLIGDKDTGKWGYINRRGDLVIEPKFDQAWYFFEGLAVVQVGKGDSSRSGYIDKTGAFVIPPKFKQAHVFKRGLANIQSLNQKWGFIDTSGKTIIEPIFDETGLGFSEAGLAPACVGRNDKNQFGLWGYISR